MGKAAQLEKTLLAEQELPALGKLAELGRKSSEAAEVAAAATGFLRVLTFHGRPHEWRGKEVVVKDLQKRRKWWQSNFTVFREMLRSLLERTEDFHVLAVRLVLEGLRCENKETPKVFPVEMLQALLGDLLCSPTWSPMISATLAELIGHYDDVAFFSLEILAKFLVDLNVAAQEIMVDESQITGGLQQIRAAVTNGVSEADLMERFADLVMKLPAPALRAERKSNKQLAEEAKMVRGKAYLPKLEVGPWKDAVQRLRRFQDCWLKFLQLSLPLQSVRSLLQHIPAIFPYLSQPGVLASFYIRSFDRGDLATSCMALSGLFYLLTKGNLGDPEVVSDGASEYYRKLYTLLSPEVFLLRRRARFLRLFFLSLKSDMLPAAYAAAFAKRCARVAATTLNTASVPWLTAVALTLTQRYSSVCKHMLHVSIADVKTVTEDPWTIDMQLDEASKVVGQTSLWEVTLLQSHFCPVVSRMSALFEQRPETDKRKRLQLNHDDWLDMDFGKLFDREVQAKRRRVATPALAFSVDSFDAAEELGDSIWRAS